MLTDIVIMEELGSTLGGSDRAKKHLTDISELGRSAGVFIVQIAQTPRAEIVGGKEGGRGSAQFQHKLCFSQPDSTNARIAGAESCLNLPPLQAIRVGLGPHQKRKYTYVGRTVFEKTVLFKRLAAASFADGLVKRHLNEKYLQDNPF